MSGPLSVLIVYKNVIYTLATAFVIVIAAVSVSSLKQTQSQAISTNTCPSTYVITVSNGPTSGVTSGLVTVGLNATPVSGTTSVSIEKVTFYLDSSRILGRGVLSTTSQYFWSMLWQSAVTLNGQYGLKAEVSHSNGFTCSVFNGPVTTVQNATRLPIPIQTIQPNSWSGPTNFPLDFQLISGTTSTTEIRQFIQVEWSTNIGSITSSTVNYIGRFSSGPNGGSGAVRARIFYGGEVKEIQAPVAITAYTNQTINTVNPPPTTATSEESSDTGLDDSTSSTIDTNSVVVSGSPTLTSQVLSSDIPVRNCLLSGIGVERLKAIEDEVSRPTATEFEKYRMCFARQSFVVAQSLSPVEPAKVRELPKSNIIVFEKAEPLRTEVEGKSIDAIVFRGKARPEATVLLYIFSEPLVLATAANASGEWTYTLEDPLEPGNHEAYSLVNTGDGDYERSSVFNFAIAKAEASEANPNGFSLQLVGTATATVDNRSQNLFVASAVSIIAVTVVALTIIISRYNKHKSILHNIRSEAQQELVQQFNAEKSHESTQQISEDIAPVITNQTITPENTIIPKVEIEENKKTNVPPSTV